MLKYRRVLSLIAFVLITGLSFVGCDDDGDESTQDARALTERDFFNNPNLCANPEEGVVVVFLEPEDAPEVDNLTGELGFDVIPYRYTRSLNNTYCFEDDNDDSEHFMILLNSDGEEVLRVLANGDCVTQLIEPGYYQVVLTHGEHVDEIEAVFLKPIPGDEQVAKRYGYVPVGFARFLENINNLITRSAIAQTDTSDNVTTLISTNACQDCDLADADLSGVDLTGADLSGADMTGANMSGVELTFADMTGADMSGLDLSGLELFESQLVGTDLSGANLSGADLRGSDLTSANLSNADLSNAILSNADLPFANLSGADVTDADFSFADLTFATWIDGGTCDFTSIGACNISDDSASPCDTITLTDNIVKCLLPSVDKEVCADACPIDPDDPAEEGCGECTETNPEDLVISVDLTEIFNQADSAFSLDLDVDKPLAILAWGGEGGVGSDGIVTSGGDGGGSGFASTVTTLSDLQNSFGQTSFYYYLAQAGTIGIGFCGDGGSSTLVMLVESGPGSLDDVVLIAGGGGGATAAGTFSDGDDGGQGGNAAASISGQGFIGVGQSVSDGPDGGSTDGDAIGGSGDNDGNDGIGGQGGSSRFGANSTWLNGDPDVGSNGRGGNADDDGVFDTGCGGGGGGYGGGGAGDDTVGAGGGSWALVPTTTCSIAPNNDSIPSNPGTDRDSLGSKNGAVEVWIFADGC